MTYLGWVKFRQISLISLLLPRPMKIYYTIGLTLHPRTTQEGASVHAPNLVYAYRTLDGRGRDVRLGTSFGR